MKRIIGIVGGVGPLAGLDLNKKIFDSTRAKKDQDHLRVILYSAGDIIGDRTDYLSGKLKRNPAPSIYKAISSLYRAGARIIGMPCNTAHAPAILTPVLKRVKKSKLRIKFVHMLDETARFIKKHYPKARRIGLLATLGTYQSRVWEDVLEPLGYRVAVPTVQTRQRIHRAIYRIKAISEAVPLQSVWTLTFGAGQLARGGADIVLLGCTEIPLALTSGQINRTVLVDPTRVLARALVRAAAPERLRP